MPLLYAVNRRQFVAEEAIEAAGSLGLTRIYTDLDGNELDPSEFEVNQYVVIQMTVDTSEDLSFVIVEDQLPGGFEALNEGLNTSSYVAPNPWEPSEAPDFETYGYNYKEIRSGRVSFFITDLDAGTRVIRYVARVTHAGEFVAMPAEVYPMYDLAKWGRSSSLEITVQR